VAVLPAANHAQFDLEAVTVHHRAILLPIAVAHHHPIGLNHQLAGRRRATSGAEPADRLRAARLRTMLVDV
jgi:hypothetical protein